MGLHSSIYNMRFLCSRMLSKMCVSVSFTLAEKQACWNLTFNVCVAVVTLLSCRALLWDLVQWSLLYFWAAELSASATLMAMWWIRIQERSLSLSLEPRATGPLRASAHLLRFSVKVTSFSEPVQGYSAMSASHLSGTLFYSACSRLISDSAVLRCVFLIQEILNKMIRCEQIQTDVVSEQNVTLKWMYNMK